MTGRAIPLDDRRKSESALRRRPQPFFALPEVPCPYLPGKFERKLLTELRRPNAKDVYDTLSHAGFRRSHRFAYRPACTDCQACKPVRVAADKFEWRSSIKRIRKRNADLTAEVMPAEATGEQFQTFARYLRSRHAEGEMADMDYANYRAMVEETLLDTTLVEFRDPEGSLVAACLTDWLSDGPSAVYSFFDPAHSSRSLGSYMVIWLVEEAVRRGLPHVYLGYWIAQSPKMAYKSRFRPLELLGPEGWRAATFD